MNTNAVASSADPTIGKGLRTRPLLLLSFAVWLAVPLVVDAQNGVAALDRDVFLSAVAEVETGGNARAVGRRGERGLYQFTRATWQRHSSRPFAEAHNPTVAHSVAVQHFNWLRARLSANGREPTAYRMAVAWNAGLGRAISGAPPRSTRDYARRVSNLAAVWRSPAPASPTSARPQVHVAMAATASRQIGGGDLSETVSFSLSARDVAPVDAPVEFSLSGPDRFALDTASVAEAEASAPAEEVSFTLAPAQEAGNAQPRRFIFATIGE
jgi:hypothetical protein